MAAIIRLATEHDAPETRAIYAPFCADDSPVSFEVAPPTVDEMRRRILKTLDRDPWLICEDRGDVLGYAYAGPHNERAAYRWSVNVSAYVREGRRRSGIGRALYTSLFGLLRLQGYYNAHAGTTLPNPGSVGLLRALGFQLVGVYRGVGYKGGAWHDVAWWQHSLTERAPDPAPPVPIRDLAGSAEWAPALSAGLPLLRL